MHARWTAPPPPNKHLLCLGDKKENSLGVESRREVGSWGSDSGQEQRADLPGGCKVSALVFWKKVSLKEVMKEEAA